MNADITINCINSIEKTLVEEDYKIVVVDNASQNGSYEQLLGEYKDDIKIHFISNVRNMGYAQGNNVGFIYAKDVLKADWICLANNDLIFSDPQWIKKSIGFYDKTHFYVLGPDIVTPTGEHQNPFKDTVPRKNQVLKKLFHDEVVYILLKLGLQRKLRKKMKLKDSWQNVNYKMTKEDFHGILHGSCLIFSPAYIHKYDGLYPGTFLYAEEEILCYILDSLGHKYSYNCDMQVIHCHSTTFKRSIQDEDKRKMQIVKHRINSYQKFLKIVNCRKNIEEFIMRERM